MGLLVWRVVVWQGPGRRGRRPATGADDRSRRVGDDRGRRVPAASEAGSGATSGRALSDSQKNTPRAAPPRNCWDNRCNCWANQCNQLRLNSCGQNARHRRRAPHMQSPERRSSKKSRIQKGRIQKRSNISTIKLMPKSNELHAKEARFARCQPSFVSPENKTETKTAAQTFVRSLISWQCRAPPSQNRSGSCNSSYFGIIFTIYINLDHLYAFEPFMCDSWAKCPDTVGPPLPDPSPSRGPRGQKPTAVESVPSAYAAATEHRRAWPPVIS